MKRRILFLLCTMWSSYFICYAQRLADPLQQVQSAVRFFEEELSEELIEDLVENPLKVNLSNLDRLESFPFFTKFMAASLHDYIIKNGPVLSIYELSAVPGFNKDVAESLAPFIDLTIQKSFTLGTISSLFQEGRSQLLIRGSFYTRQQEGYMPISEAELKLKPDSRYSGYPGRVYAQYKFDVPGKFKFALTSEKDPGEKYGDYTGFSLQAENIGKISKIVAGDFSARFGQGLVLWNTSSIFSSSAMLVKQEYGLSSYSSTDENRSFRGAGISCSTDKINISLLGSSKWIDARIADGGFTSLLTTGLHNTTSTLSRRKTLNLTTIGANLSYSASWLKTGITISGYKYSLPYTGRDSSQISRQKAFGNYGGNAGADFYAFFSNFRIFGEYALDLSVNQAVIAGFAWRPSYNFDLSFAARYYSDEYLSPFGGALSRSGKMRGERAVDVYLTRRGVKGTQFKGWMSYGSGMKLPRSVIELILPLSTCLDLLLRADFRDHKGSVRIQTEWESSRIFTITARGEANRVTSGENTSYGWMVFSELIGSLPSGFADASFRISVFNTPEWDNRIYAYEKDLLYGFSVPALYGKGIRGYLNLHFALFKWMDFWLKGSLWHYTNREYTGDGPSRMEGPSSFEIKWEVRFKF